MSRHASPTPSSKLTMMLSGRERTTLDLYLFSEAEGRIPLGSYKNFFDERIREFFHHKSLDLAPYGFALGSEVRGNPDTIARLETLLRSIS